jgi:hypothetical protein
MRGGSRSSRTRGGMRWTRQRQAGTKVAGRKPGARMLSSCGGAFELRTWRERSKVRLTTTLRGAGRGGDAPHLHRLCAAAQVVWSFRNPDCSFARHRHEKVPRRRRRQASAVAGESTKQAEKPSRAERRMCPVLSWWLTRALFFAHEAADASRVRRSARPHC